MAFAADLCNWWDRCKTVLLKICCNSVCFCQWKCSCTVIPTNTKCPKPWAKFDFSLKLKCSNIKSPCERKCSWQAFNWNINNLKIVFNLKPCCFEGCFAKVKHLWLLLKASEDCHDLSPRTGRLPWGAVAWLESCRGRDQAGTRKPKALLSDMLNLNLLTNQIKKSQKTKNQKKSSKSCAVVTVLQISWVVKYFFHPNPGHLD